MSDDDATPAAPASAAGAGRKQKLFPKDWLQIVSLAEDGVKIREIAETYGVEVSAIYRGLRKRRVNLTAIALKAEQEESQKNHQETLKRIRDTKDRDYRMTEFLQTQVIKVVSDAQKAGRPVGSELDSVKALKIAMDAIKGGTANKWVLLGLDKAQEDPDAHLPELPIMELSPAEEKAMRDRQNLEDGLLDEESAQALLDEIDPDEENSVVAEEDDP
jgi:IS30 family transposase